MASELDAREIGYVGSAAWPLTVGIEGRYVTIGMAGETWLLDAADQEKFGQLLVAAVWQAKANAEAARGAGADG